MFSYSMPKSCVTATFRFKVSYSFMNSKVRPSRCTIKSSSLIFGNKCNYPQLQSHETLLEK